MNKGLASEEIVSPLTPETPRVPGEAGVWIFILGDMVVFSLFFTVFVYYRGHDIELYLQSQATLNQFYGVLNTLFLLTSSWFVVMGVEGLRSKAPKYSPHFFILAMACGIGFSWIKIIEYKEKVSAGITLTTNDFYMYYYIFTGLHFLHVLIGLGVLLFLLFKAKIIVQRSSHKSTGTTQKEMTLIESGASYWHMVDLLWIVIFPLLYLLK